VQRTVSAGARAADRSWAVLTEVCYLAESRLGSEAEALFLDSIATGELQLEAVVPQDVARMAELVRQYSDFPLGAVDASVVAVAERLGWNESPRSIVGISPWSDHDMLRLLCYFRIEPLPGYRLDFAAGWRRAG
jgi:hypothetical protein